jgi:hypothetical protein
MADGWPETTAEIIESSLDYPFSSREPGVAGLPKYLNTFRYQVEGTEYLENMKPELHCRWATH